MIAMWTVLTVIGMLVVALVVLAVRDHGQRKALDRYLADRDRFDGGFW